MFYSGQYFHSSQLLGSNSPRAKLWLWHHPEAGVLIFSKGRSDALFSLWSSQGVALCLHPQVPTGSNSLRVSQSSSFSQICSWHHLTPDLLRIVLFLAWCPRLSPSSFFQLPDRSQVTLSSWVSAPLSPPSAAHPLFSYLQVFSFDACIYQLSLCYSVFPALNLGCSIACSRRVFRDLPLSSPSWV